MNTSGWYIWCRSVCRRYLDLGSKWSLCVLTQYPDKSQLAPKFLLGAFECLLAHLSDGLALCAHMPAIRFRTAVLGWFFSGVFGCLLAQNNWPKSIISPSQFFQVLQLLSVYWPICLMAWLYRHVCTYASHQISSRCEISLILSPPPPQSNCAAILSCSEIWWW